jgi:DNA-binding CsgD family transcriptional regulator
MFLSVLTVETHRKKVMEKLGLRGAPEAVLYAVRRGMVR